MGRVRSKQETIQKRAADKAAEWLTKFGGVAPEEVAIPEVIEQEQDLMLEAQSVINYYKVKGEGFRHIICENCNQQFAYSWNIAGIKCCSVICMSKKLEKMGLRWDPYREPERRWGTYAPALVPPAALKSIQQLLADAQEGPDHSTSDE